MKALSRLGTGKKVALGFGVIVLIAIVLAGAFGSAGENDAYQPQDEFKLDPWIPIKIGGGRLSIKKAPLVLFLAPAVPPITMGWVAARLEPKADKRAHPDGGA